MISKDDKLKYFKKWYVYYTYPKFERKVYDYLQQDNMSHFIIVLVIRQWSDRKKRIELP
ncbi:MAG: hypothetical protein GQ564_19175 [Bacteroidales bacterium]|nr:hypothetical protein [Bacteroidales bacterium]